MTVEGQTKNPGDFRWMSAPNKKQYTNSYMFVCDAGSCCGIYCSVDPMALKLYIEAGSLAATSAGGLESEHFFCP